jgi:hypothetical protein
MEKEADQTKPAKKALATKKKEYELKHTRAQRRSGRSHSSRGTIHEQGAPSRRNRVVDMRRR